MIEEKAPYLVVIFDVKPIDDTVEIFNWQEKEKWAFTEMVYFETEISNDLYNSAHVILDVLNGKMRKSELKNVKDQELIEYYFKIYDKNIVDLVKFYFKQYPEAWQSLLTTAASAARQLDNAE